MKEKKNFFPLKFLISFLFLSFFCSFFSFSFFFLFVYLFFCFCFKGRNDRLLFTIGFLVAHHSSFYGYNLFLYLCRRYKWFKQYEINPGKTPPYSLARNAFVELLFTHYVATPILVYFAYTTLKKWRVFTMDPIVPGLFTWIYQVAFKKSNKDNKLLYFSLTYTQIF